MSDIFHLHNFIWTTQDFEKMNWRDASIYAFAFLPKRAEFVLDIDYILQRTAQNESQPGFLIAPATLVFENVWELKIELEPDRQIEIINIARSEPRNPKNPELLNREIEGKWTIETNQGDVAFRATGYKQHFKGLPLFGLEKTLDLDLRGGFSFSRVNE
ncbi:MAG: hypothetical protein M3209_10895 [Acidobacteriota bacterium]|nr:hypothetical protein [Acidobacteriota bacterium]